MPGRRTAYHNDPVPGRQILKDDLIPGHPFIIDDEDDELTQQSSDQIANSVWNAGMQDAMVAAAVFANKVLQYLKKTATRGLMFRMEVISWHLGDFVIGSMSDGRAVQKSRRTHDDPGDA